MSDDYEPSRREWWVDYTLEKIGAVLFAQELRQESRNGWFTWMWVFGVVFIGSTIWRYNGDLAAGRTSDPWAFAWVVLGALLFVAGVALRINGGIEIRQLRRLQKLASMGKIPD